MSSEASSNSVLVTAPLAAKPPAAKSAWSPLAVPIFRALWIGYVLSQIGISAREAGAQWLMTELVQNPHERSSWLGLIQTVFYVPVCVLSIAAGVWADITDRRRLLILTNLAILIASTILGVITLAGLTTPTILLVFLFVLGVGTALSGPAFQYVIPELVPPNDMPLAISLNSVALNVGRAVGPALGMVVVYLVGIWTASKTRGTGASFLINALGFVPVVWVLVRWKRAPQKYLSHPETWMGATRTAFGYTANSPAMRAILVRVAAFVICAMIVWSQIAMIARVQLHGGEGVLGFLMAAVGTGAVIGVFCMPYLERRFSTDGMVTICTAVFGIALMALSQCQGRWANMWLASSLAMVIGFNWVVVPTNFNIATQRSVPGWVKGRAIAMYMTVLFGSFAVGGAVWGRVADLYGISNASLIAGILIVVGLALVKAFPLTRAKGHDFTPAHQTAPIGEAVAGALQMVIGYVVHHARAVDFVRSMHHGLRRQRLRNGATQWKLTRREGGESRDGGVVYEESVTFANWNDRLRFHARTTKTDAVQEEEVRGFLVGSDAPVIEYRVVEPIASSATGHQATVPRHIPHPPPVIDWNRMVTRMLEEFDAVWNRIMRMCFNGNRKR